MARAGRSAPARRARVARHTAALHAPGRSARARPRRPQRRRHHAHRLGQDALLQPAGAEHDPAGSVDAARCICFRPRRSRRTSSPSCSELTSAGGRGGGDGDRRVHLRRRHAAGRAPRHPRRARTSCSPIPTCCTRASCRTIRKWAKLFENLRYVVIDELHAYRGVFGSHLANVLRRLRRICRHYGSDPLFICSSATIANPARAGGAADGAARSSWSSESGAPRGEKFFLFVNPPVVNQELGIRRSYLSEARRVAGEFLKRQPAAHRLLPEPPVHRDPDDVSEGRFRGRRPGRPSRCAAIAAATCRCDAARSSAGCAKAGARRRRDQRARAWHRHRRARRGGHGRLSGHDRLDVAARGPRRPASGPLGRGDGGQQRADRSVRRRAIRRISSTRRPSTRSSTRTTCTSWSTT